MYHFYIHDMNSISKHKAYIAIYDEFIVYGNDIIPLQFIKFIAYDPVAKITINRKVQRLFTSNNRKQV